MNCSLAATMTQDGYVRFGRRFIETFLKHWPKNATLYIMAEGFMPKERADNLICLDLVESSPGMREFKRACAYMPVAHGRIGKVYDYQLDAVKWSHRIFALQAVAERVTTPLLVNIDADIVTFDDVPEWFVEALLPPPFGIAYMPRKQQYSECSFVVYRLEDPLVRAFIQAHHDWYVTGKVFELERWTDCHIFDAMLPKVKFKVRNINAGLPWTFHPFVNGPLGKYMDHAKGPRKDEGHSRMSDLAVERTEDYWQKLKGNDGTKHVETPR